MPERFDVEIGEDSKSTVCHCCGKESCTGHGFIYKNGDAYAVYYVGWSLHHSERKVSLALAVGEWSDSSTSDDRVCIGLEAYEGDNEILIKIIEPSESPWPSTELLGQMLSRKDAMNYAALKEIFSMTETLLRKHKSVRSYLNIPDEEDSKDQVH